MPISGKKKMSKIGKKPVLIPEGVTVEIQNGTVTVRGNKGEVNISVPDGIKVESKEGKLLVTRWRNDKKTRACHGTVRSLLQNAVLGVTEGWKKELEVMGVGYRVAKQGEKLVLTLGFSHPVEVDMPQDLTVDVQENKIIVSGVDKQRVGLFAAQVRAICPPDAYKERGIRYTDEEIRLKPGKMAKTGGEG